MKKMVVLISCFMLVNPIFSQTVKNVTALEAQPILQTLNKRTSVIIDARDSVSFCLEHIENAINIDGFSPKAKNLIVQYVDKKSIVVYCTYNSRSSKIIELLKNIGYKGEIFDITDGINGLKANNFPLVSSTQMIKEHTRQPDTTFKPSGKAILQVFGNFDYNATQDVQKKYGFWFGRAHFGYEYQFNKQFSGKIIIDAGRPTTVGQIEVTDTTGLNLNTSNTSKEGSYYTMTLKFASLQWQPNQHLRIQAGGVLQNHYITQERFWGYRYVAPTFQDKYYGIPSTDLGIISYFTINEKVSFDLALTNGEGFRFDQDAYGDVKMASGVDYKPFKGLQTRVYFDYTQSDNPSKPAEQQLFSFFAGYTFKQKFRIGGELNYRENNQNINNHDLFGYSVFGAYRIFKQIELFARFDNLQANTINNDIHNWYYQNTGKAYISGIHYNATKGVNISINYQGWQPDDASINFQHHAVLSFEYKI